MSIYGKHTDRHGIVNLEKKSILFYSLVDIAVSPWIFRLIHSWLENELKQVQIDLI